MFRGINLQESHQQEPAFGREKEQVENSAGGYTFQLDKWDRLKRFLILGTEGGTYYVGEHKLTLDNVKSVIKCIKEDGFKTVRITRDISFSGRAPKNDYAIFVLALIFAYGNANTKQYARSVFNDVVRIGTHLYQFVDYLKKIGAGWGQSKKKAISDWITSKSVDDLAYQFLKYQNRVGWRNVDIIRISHPIPVDDDMSNLLAYFAGKKLGTDDRLPELVDVYEKIKKVEDVKTVCKLIEDCRLTREFVPTQFLSCAEVWEAMLPNLPLTALIRNLGKLTQVEALRPLGDNVDYVCKKLTNDNYIKKSRIHPYSVLNALSTYNAGKGVKGKLTWEPINKISDALEEMFYKSFGNVKPTNRRIVLALDVSGSMTWPLFNNPHISARVASACMAMVTARTEPNYQFVAFSHRMIPLNITAKDSFNGVLKKISGLPFGGTDCALPMLWAIKNKINVDAFVVYTDNETWYGKIHPFQALKKYRKFSGIKDAKLVVVGMTSTGFSIADPKDANMMDVVGFDSAAPNLISDFVRGEI